MKFRGLWRLGAQRGVIGFRAYGLGRGFFGALGFWGVVRLIHIDNILAREASGFIGFREESEGAYRDLGFGVKGVGIGFLLPSPKPFKDRGGF